MNSSKLFIAICLFSIVVFGCKNEEKQTTKDDHKEHSEHSMETLSVEKRVAFMSGHVEAGLALYRAGFPEQAAKHLLHPVSETHQAERAGIEALGFKSDIFKSVSKSLEEGLDASEIEPMLTAAEENIALLQKNSGGNLSETITFLMNTIDEEYSIGVKNGVITDLGEYQDAYGFSIVALKYAKRIENSEGLVEDIKKLIEMWPNEGPLADSMPASVEKINNQTKRILESLDSL